MDLYIKCRLESSNGAKKKVRGQESFPNPTGLVRKKFKLESQSGAKTRKVEIKRYPKLGHNEMTNLRSHFKVPPLGLMR